MKNSFAIEDVKLNAKNDIQHNYFESEDAPTTSNIHQHKEIPVDPVTSNITTKSTAANSRPHRHLQSTTETRAVTYGTTLVWGKSYLSNPHPFTFRTVPTVPKSNPSGFCSDPSVVRVAIIDSGVDINHAAVNCNAPPTSQLGLPSETTTESANGRCRGASFDDTVGGTEQWYEPANLAKEGTLLYGIIDATIQAAAVASAAYAGINPNSAEIPVCYLIARIFNNAGENQFMSIALKALEWAVAQGADVANLSFSSTIMSPDAAIAFQNAFTNGAVNIVASAGNSGGTSVSYPAGYAGVLAVGAVDENQAILPFSQQNELVDLVAPGARINSTALGGGYALSAGTSFSTSFVTGALAALRANCPRCSNRQIDACVIARAQDLGTPNRDNAYGNGSVNPVGAYDCLVNSLACCTLGGVLPPMPPSISPTFSPVVSQPRPSLLPAPNVFGRPRPRPMAGSVPSPSINPSVPQHGSPIRSMRSFGFQMFK
jgi:hypothetical protein